uniref:Uncharacterized protein n=1 Tax=Daphnia magna TaxID=35525 RepID=A0A0N8DS79_9CRUS
MNLSCLVREKIPECTHTHTHVSFLPSTMVRLQKSTGEFSPTRNSNCQQLGDGWTHHGKTETY